MRGFRDVASCASFAATGRGTTPESGKRCEETRLAARQVDGNMARTRLRLCSMVLYGGFVRWGEADILTVREFDPSI